MKSIAKAAQKKSTSAAVLSEVGFGLQDLSRQVAAFDGTNVGLLDTFATSTLAAADVAKAAVRKALSDEDAFGLGIDLASALMEISDSLVVAANSLRLPCSHGDEGADRDALLAEIASAQDEAGEIAHRFFLDALSVEAAIGVAVTDRAFTWPDNALRAASCCGGRRSRSGAGSSSAAAVIRESVDIAALKRSAETSGERAAELAGGLLRMAIVMQTIALAWISPCSSACTAGNWQMVIGTSGTRNVNGQAQPYFTYDWNYCCQNKCLWFWTDEFWQPAGTTSHDLGNAFPANRQAAAARLAARGLRAAFNAWTGQAGGVTRVLGRNIVPAVTPPAVPAC
ncbi:MAG: hypothetical protein KDJ86_04565 [Bauldia sp.]|uniref:hypothetical protein n=1 Tax=Bauldia sp. TaxID=2575872 RepID=UPI001DEC0973|nr:hypothetical protein [Bauldia sp.]MCB1495036.1 hypothetical protein [Bauldia sp.]